MNNSYKSYGSRRESGKIQEGIGIWEGLGAMDLQVARVWERVRGSGGGLGPARGSGSRKGTWGLRGGSGSQVGLGVSDGVRGC